jgi:hypothetical protein
MKRYQLARAMLPALSDLILGVAMPGREVSQLGRISDVRQR